MPIFSKTRIACASVLAASTIVLGASTSSEGRDFRMKGLTAPVTIEMDAHAVPRIIAEDAEDAHAALGFLHARHRFFQMDILRRSAAGELAALAGPALLPLDREPAIARRRSLAQTILASLPADQRTILDVYSQGVNAGMGSWTEPPIEYSILNATPRAWSPEDCVLVVLAMFDLLQRTSDQEARVAALRSLVSEDSAMWLLSTRSPWDALLIEPQEPEAPMRPPLPSTRNRPVQPEREHPSDLLADPLHPGSNSFAVAAARSGHGGAILANDPHLRYLAPGIWYRVAFAWPGVEAVGLTLPGTPGVTIGSTTRIAWGLTNTTGDFEDLVLVRRDPDDPDRYRGPDGWERYDDRDVTIEIAGSRPQTIRSRFTRWGPVVQSDDSGDVALLRTMDQPNAVNFDILDYYEAANVDEGLDIAAGWGGPSQNVLVVDSDGRIGWTISGWLPNRIGYDGLSSVAHDAQVGWFGPLPEAERPRVVDPPSGVLFTANNRLVPEPQASRIGQVWAGPGRAYRIRELLGDRETFVETDLFELQHDEFIQRFVPYRALLIAALDSRPDLPGGVETAAMIRRWDGRASADTLAVPVVSAFRRSALESAKIALLERLGRPDVEADPTMMRLAAMAMNEAPVLAAIQSQDPDLLPAAHPGWTSILDQATRDAIDAGLRNGDTPWAERNRGLFQHPLGQAHPLVGSTFDLPPVPQPGHWGAVRVQAGGFGASARLVAAPTRLEDGILTTPGGQSGDPKSPHFDDLHASWSTAEPTSLLPGETVETIRILPSDA